MASSPEKPETALLSAEASSRLPQQAQIALQQVDNLKYFLISAPVDWAQDQYIRRFLLPTGEYVSCVLWNTLFHISGTDIVRCLAFRFHAFGRPVKNHKKFEEGIFSDLRNLKAGTDASLEEPKSPFLDFLYKNNCIRTQKKQKVFYWYSVPHDRLFLDALERDLKREKAGQEATTAAESEPALSFEFDASQSLFDQLTKAQAGSVSAAFATQHAANTSESMTHQSGSPSSRAADSMPPPPSSTQSQQMVSHAAQYMSQESLNDVSSFSQMTMPASTAIQPMIPAKREHYYDQVITAPYDRNSFSQQPLAHMQHHRQSSVPSYIECSPAPSFVSAQSHYDEYSARGFSYPPEPTTPPQQSVDCTPEPSYLTPDGVYSSNTTVLDNKQNFTFGSTPQYNQYGIALPQYPPTNCGQMSVGPAMYSHLDGSPNYKQKRRRTSISQAPQSIMMMTNNFAPKPADAQASSYLTKRPGDLRRAVSASYVPQNVNGNGFERDLSSGPVARGQSMTSFLHTPDVSRHGSPMASIENPDIDGRNERANSISGSYNFSGQVPQYPVGAVRRARSATMTEAGIYGAKTHSCPIPGCGRVFKRLEHLKRHVKTHTQERPHVCPECNKAFSRSDNLAQHRRTHENDASSFSGSVSYVNEEMYENEDQLSSLVEARPDISSNNFPQRSTSVQMTNYSRPGSMGPPPLPITAHGY